MQNNRSKVVFKDYNFNQNLLLPPSLEEMIPENHPVRVVNYVIDNLDLEPLLKRYKGGGTSSYHPRLMLKVLIYGYLSNHYSSRKIEQALQQNIHFMWLSGMSYPDHNTINRFRSERLKNVLKEVFSQVVLLLVDLGHVSIKEAYLDGTKIEANANRYTFVWRKTAENQLNKIKAQLKELWDYAESVAKAEILENEPSDFEQIDPQKVKETIDQIDKALQGKNIDPQIKKKLTKAKKELPDRVKKYQDQKEKIGTHRSSMSKTDPDATFMRLKEEHLFNGQLKPAYNVQFSTENQCIIWYTLHPLAGDTTTLPVHLQEFTDTLGVIPEAIIADAGYGSEENYQYLKDKGIDAYIKYNTFEKEKTQKWQQDLSRIENLYYNPEQDCYYCPMGQKMNLVDSEVIISDNGYEQFKKFYQAQNCNGCPMRGPCNKSPGNRRIGTSPKMQKHRAEARELLNSEQGLKYRSKRSVDVEPVFGMIKYNRNYRRFLLRGIEKVEIETGLLAIAHNLKKMAS
jgi:transposase